MNSRILPGPNLLSRFRGCMIGALVGDCLGEPYEFDFHEIKSEPCEFMSKLLNGESDEILPYTDDTAMTLSLAKSLIEKGELDLRDLAEKFVVEYYKDPKRGYGKRVVDVFKALNDSKFEDILLPAKLQFNGSGSYGNGSAMRISPLALFASIKGESFLKDAVKQSSLLTHTNPIGYNGAILQALAIQAALRLDPQKTLDPIDFVTQLKIKMEEIETDVDEKSKLSNRLQKILDHKEDRPPRRIGAYLGNGVSALKSVPAAIYCFLRGMRPLPDFESPNPFVRTIYFAINMGGDTDTIASMAGSICGAYYGVEGIPEVLQKRCEMSDEVDQLAEKLYNAALKEAS